MMSTFSDNLSSSVSSSSTSSTTSSTSSRFSLILLEPGEIYFEDYLVYYHELKCPFKDSSSTANQSAQAKPSAGLIQNDPALKQQKGNLKICSKSIVFDPINSNYPLIKFQYKMIEKIEQFDSDELADEDEEDIYSLTKKSSISSSNSLDQQILIKKCFAIRVKQTIECKQNNKIGPYTLVKRDKPNDCHYFQFIFTNVNDSLDLMRQLHRASTLDFEQEDLMLQLILKSRLARTVKFDLHSLDDMYKEQIQFESEVNKINPLVANPGKIILSNMCLYYKPFNNLDNEKQLIKIKLKNIKYVIKRRYHLKKVGCEIVFEDEAYASSNYMDFFSDHYKSKSNESDASALSGTRSLPYLYLTFEDELKRDLFYTRLVVDQRDKLINLNEFSQENMLQKWRYGVISNFSYLMYLNNMADRSYNDLTQYPVFPWVLSDYTSDSIDLNDPKSYRDLSKPIGALNDDRLQRLRQRCKEMQAATTGFSGSSTDNSNQPMFLYGSHYSTPAFVSYYLVRQCPEWQLCLQNGRFDHPNRLFHSIADTWKNCLLIDSDVKELIPEFYDISNSSSFNLTDLSKPEIGSFLRNNYELDLGLRQDGIRVNHVLLPRWARNSPKEFILKMRDALESSFVSENLHKWIDLIFGYKQRGEEALKADNLFYYLCYEGAVDLNSIKSYSERKSLEIQIQEFGQIPTQLFNTPHLPRAKIDLINNQKLLGLSNLTNDQTNQMLTTIDKQFDLLRIKPNSSNEMKQNENKNLNSNLTNQNKKLKQFERNPFRINASNFKNLSLKLSVKLHKGQINDCLFIEQSPSAKSNSKQRLSLDESKSKTNKTEAHKSLNVEANLNKKIKLPLVCSVSNDNWIKIYSLEDRSLFRSHNVCNFSLSSVDCIQISSNSSLFETLPSSTFSSTNEMSNESTYSSDDEFSLNKSKLESDSHSPFSRTLLFLSCWDNGMYIYDMNYNRCIFSLNNAHDDAVSRARIIKFNKNKPKSLKASLKLNKSKNKTIRLNNFILIFTSSWDSIIKVWRAPLKNKKRTSSIPGSSSLSQFLLNTDSIRVEFLTELCHDSSIVDFQLSKSYLTSICDDGNLYLWKIDSKRLIKCVNANIAYLNESDDDESSDSFSEETEYNHEDDDDDDDENVDEKDHESEYDEQLEYDYSQDEYFNEKREKDQEKTKIDLDKYDYESCFTFLYSIQSSSDIGKINDCKIVESNMNESNDPNKELNYLSKNKLFNFNSGGTTKLNNSNNFSTLAICTSLGYIKIYNIQTNSELFSLRLSPPSSLNSQLNSTSVSSNLNRLSNQTSQSSYSKLNKLFYSLDYIVTIDSTGHVYFIDLKQEVNSSQVSNSLPKTSSSSHIDLSSSGDQSNTLKTAHSNSSFLSHTIKLGSNCLQSLCIYKESIICAGDSDGNLYFLSLIDF